MTSVLSKPVTKILQFIAREQGMMRWEFASLRDVVRIIGFSEAHCTNKICGW